MAFIDISIRNLRIYSDIDLELDPSANLIIGDNASGKTSILEAIHIISTGKSFRSADIEKICRHGNGGLRITANVSSRETRDQISLHVEGNSKKFVLNGLPDSKISEIAYKIPVIIISPDSHYLFQSKSIDRRSVLDWLLFHVKPQFREIWSKYNRILTQRNTQLKTTNSPKTLDIWDQELVDAGNTLTELRLWATAQILPIYQEICSKIFQDRLNVEIRYLKGWDDSLDLYEAIKNERKRDLKTGLTNSGPHRADLEICIDSKKSRDFSSHGQKKLLYVSLRLAQSKCLRSLADKHCTILIDDITAELDPNNQATVLGEIGNQENQCFITATHLIKDLDKTIPKYKLFHVKHGSLAI